MSQFTSIKDALALIKSGKLIILVDNPDRENEGDFFMPAEAATPEKVNFMIRYGRGLICVALDNTQAWRLNLTPMIPSHLNSESTKVNFAVSVNAKNGTTSGISAYDRAKTIQTLANPDSNPSDLTIPGHVFPLIAHADGLPARQGHTEAAVTLSKLASLRTAGVICEILKDDGQMARLPDLLKIAKKYQLPVVSIDDLVKYTAKHPVSFTQSPSVFRTASSTLPINNGIFKIYVYRSAIDNSEHTALVLENKKVPVLTRMHSQCLTGDTLGSLLCDCGEQLRTSLEFIQQKGGGVLLYLNQEGRGIGLTSKIKAYAKQETGMDTVEANLALGLGADVRDYKIAADVLQDLGIDEIELLSNNPAKASALEAFGIKISSRIGLQTTPTDFNKSYLATKKHKLGHQLDLA